MLILAMDPSLTATGLAALDFKAKRVVDWECVSTKVDHSITRKTDDMARRVSLIFERTMDFIERNKGAIAIEAQVGSSYGNKASLKNVAALMAGYSACLCAAAAFGKKPILVMPSVVKSRVTGSKGASKQETWNQSAKHFTSFPPDPSTKPAREAVQDAVAVGLAALPELKQLRDFQGSQ